MELFRLTIDFAFKAVFGKNPDILLAMLNSVPQFQGQKAIKSLEVLNPEISKELEDEKLSILDIKAEDLEGNQFLVEMQAFPQSEFPKRALYYWAKAYTRTIGKGKQYSKLKKVYSFNFLNFVLFKTHKKFLSTYILQEKELKTDLTDDLEINIIEIPKFVKESNELKEELDYWVYLLRDSQKLKGETMKVLEKKNPKLKKAISELKTVSLDKKNREYYEMRRKAELDYNTNIESAFKKGLSEGIEKGIEQKSIEIALVMLSKNQSLDFISEVTNLSLEQIKSLKKKK